MNLAELYGKLKENGIDDDSIYLHGLKGCTDDNEKLSMSIKKGKYSTIWEVYYRERGERHSIRKFNDESSACQYYLKQMTDK
jgi:hypothetical protein